jgi:NADH dehydrogenase (ubiquinone) 1 alpha/beta subcomplex 1, acyl-carrier protein
MLLRSARALPRVAVRPALFALRAPVAAQLHSLRRSAPLMVNAPAPLCVPLLRRTMGTFLDKADVTDRVLGCLKNFQKVDPSKVTETSHFLNDLGLDSLDTVEVVMAFEDEFVIEIPDADAEKIHSCEDAIAYITQHPHAK